MCGDERLLYRLGCGGFLRRHGSGAHHDGIDWCCGQTVALRPRAQQVLCTTRWGTDSPTDGEKNISPLTDSRVGSNKDLIEAF